jgi:hypothetical protein
MKHIQFARSKEGVMSSSGAIQWRQAMLVGTSPSRRVTVYVDATLAQAGEQNAQDLLADADRVVRANDHFFGSSTGSVNAIVFALGGMTDGSGGAAHTGCRQ